MTDAFDLARFETAQEPIIETALEELRRGRKHTHWMWFVFPQMRGLGRSAMAQIYGIGSLAEARAFLAHPLLGERLATCTLAVLDHPATSLEAIFGSPDDMKFCSSMTLFACAAAKPKSMFHEALDRFCDGCEDERTRALLRT